MAKAASSIAICNRNKLAKTSQTRAKTRLINYFLINKSFYLVDLPGYGFARASKTEQRDWDALIGGYLSSGRPKHLSCCWTFAMRRLRKTGRCSNGCCIMASPLR